MHGWHLLQKSHKNHRPGTKEWRRDIFVLSRCVAASVEYQLKVSAWGVPGIGEQIFYTPDAANVRKQIPNKSGFSPIVNNLKNAVPGQLKPDSLQSRTGDQGYANLNLR